MKPLFSACILACVLFFFACNKASDTPPTPQQVDSVKIFGVDSSKLVRSLTEIWTDSSGNFQDSNIVYFYYDTISRSIFWDKTSNTDLNPANHSLAYSYNTKYLLNHIKRNTTDLEDTGSAVTIDYTYDNANIIKS